MFDFLVAVLVVFVLALLAYAALSLGFDGGNIPSEGWNWLLNL
jgi:hypothetical protein